MQLTNTWRTPRFTRTDIYCLLMALSVQGLIRAYAYTDIDDGGDIFVLVENTMALVYWGYLLYATMAVLAVGLVLRNHTVIWVGHSLCALVYFVLLFGISLNVVTPEGDLAQALIYGSLLVTPFVLHLLFSLRMGASPLEESHTSFVESVVGEDGN